MQNKIAKENDSKRYLKITRGKIGQQEEEKISKVRKRQQMVEKDSKWQKKIANGRKRQQMVEKDSKYRVFF